VKRTTVAIVSTIALLLGLGGLVPAAPALAAPVPAPRLPGGDSNLDVYTGEMTLAQLGTVRSLGIDQEDLTLKKAATAGRVGVEVVLNGSQAARLARQGVPLAPKQVRGQDAGQRLRAQAAAGFQVFRSYSEAGGIRDELVQTAKDNPDLTKLESTGTSINGQDILVLKVTKQASRIRDGARPSVLYVSTQHAREWITPEMNRRLMHYVLDRYGRDPRITRLLDTTELWFEPVANPDGYDFTFTAGNRLWRKNLRDNDGDGRITQFDGVDPNRNFAYKWGFDNEGSSPDPTSQTYRGTGPASEPETKALDGLMKRVRFDFTLNYHSAAELILHGTSWQVTTPVPDDIIADALGGDPATPAVPGYFPEQGADLYTTNGDTDGQAHEIYSSEAFTVEMATCQTASAVDPNDAFDPADCPSGFSFPDSEPLIQGEFEKNIPFALSLAESAKDPANPVSSLGRTTPDFQTDPFTISYGDPQTVAVTARRSIKDLRVQYRVNGGRAQSAPVHEWRGGERYGDLQDVFYAEFRGEVRGTRAGDRVEVWFTGSKPGTGRVNSPSFTYQVARDSKAKVLVLANEDYKGVNPTYPPGTDAPKYAQEYVRALAANGIASEVFDVDAMGVPHHLGVLSHFQAVVWYLGDNRLTMDPEDAITDTFVGPLPDASVAEREEFVTMAVRDFLNEGGKLVYTGETTGYYGVLAHVVGGIYTGLHSDPTKDCVVTVNLAADCALLSDDFTQYYLGTWDRTTLSLPTGFDGTDRPLRNATANLGGAPSNPDDEAGALLLTSDVLPAKQFPLFNSWVSSRYIGGSGPFQPVQGAWYAAAPHRDQSYQRLMRTVDLRNVPASAVPTLRAQLSFDTEPGFDNVIVEAHTVGAEDWTTLPDLNGGTDTAPPDQCEVGFLLALHPWLGHYLTLGDTACANTGTSGSWNRFTGFSNGFHPVAFDLSAYAGKQVEVSISFVTDPASGGFGAFVDDTSVTTTGGTLDAENFETGLGPWSVPGPPPGSPLNPSDFRRSQSLTNISSVSTKDTVTLGFGIEQLATDADRAAVLGKLIRGLVPHI
jgi:Zinc carboxypeptidase